MQFSPEQAQGLSMFLIPAIENEIPTTAKVLAAVPESQLDFKLGDKGWPCKDLMWHIVSSDIWFADGIAAGEFAAEPATKPAPGSPKEIAEKYQTGLAAAMAKVKTLSPEQLAKPINFYNIMNLPAVMYLGFLNNHCIHHRGYLAAYLRAMNARVPSIYGGSADEPFQAAATN
jgi:uncharacterized damage-inducible protein DinB